MKLKYLCLIASILFIGCASLTENKEPHRLCVANCDQVFQTCRSACDKSCFQCEKNAVHQAKARYARYKHERCLKGQTFIRRLQSFHDPLQCRKASCDCVADYQVCRQACDGKIKKQIEVEKVCC